MISKWAEQEATPEMAEHESTLKMAELEVTIEPAEYSSHLTTTYLTNCA